MRAVVALVGILIAFGWRQEVPPVTPCESGGALRPSHDLYCIELAPIPALEGARGSVELGRIPSPFGVNVNRDGRQLYAPVMRVQGLLAADSFAPGARYWMAWIATQQLALVKSLGVVGKGGFNLPTVDWPKFLILITAESSSNPAEPKGRVALRGLSPSSRMMPPDMSQFIYGAVPTGGAGHLHDSAGWVHPSMPPGLSMMPAEMQLPPPAATPFLPSEARAAPVPEAEPRQVARVRNGDTLVLVAMPVRRSVGGRSFIGYGYNGQ